jgi:hypothetical protein
MRSTLPVAPPPPRWTSHPLRRLLATETACVLDGPAVDLDSAYETLVMERWVAAEASGRPPWAPAAFYRLRGAIPRWLQLALRRAEQPDLWSALPRDIARWWRHRDSAETWSPADHGTASLTTEGRLVFEGPA